MEAAGGVSDKVRIIMHGVTLESAAGGGGDYLRILNSARDLAFFSPSGLVGIGTTAPIGRLHVQGGLAIGNPGMPFDPSADVGSKAGIMLAPNVAGQPYYWLAPSLDGGLIMGHGLTVGNRWADSQTLLGLAVNGDLGIKGDMSAVVFHSRSDRAVKANFGVVDPKEILRSLVSMPIQSWSFKSDPNGRRHIGPMAQDFHAAFSLDGDDKHIATVDADGVALAAIQGLHQIVTAQSKELSANAETIQSLQNRLARLERLMANPTFHEGSNPARTSEPLSP